MENTTDSIHFKAETDDDNIVWLHFDKADAGTNVLSAEVFEQLDQHIQTIAAQRPRGLVIISDKANGFIAGADITAFTKVNQKNRRLNFCAWARMSSTGSKPCPFPPLP